MRVTAEGRWEHPEIQKIVKRVAQDDKTKIAALHDVVDYLGAVVTYPQLEEKLSVPDAFDHPLFTSTKVIYEFPGRAIRSKLQEIKTAEQDISEPRSMDTLLKMRSQQVIVSFLAEASEAQDSWVRSVSDHGLSPKIKRSPFIPPELLASRFGIPLDTTVGLLSEVAQASGNHLESQAVGILLNHIKPQKPDSSMEVSIQPFKHKWTAEADPVTTIHDEIRGIIATQGEVTKEDLTKRKLYYAVYRYYPGQYVQLRWDFGLPLVEKPKGYWTIERIRKEVRGIIQGHGKFTESLAITLGRQDILGAIGNHTSGGVPQFLRSMGLTPTHNRRSVEQIDEDALGVWLRYGDLSDKNIKKVQGLYAAIGRRGKGKFRGVRARVGTKAKSILDNAYAENEERSSQLKR